MPRDTPQGCKPTDCTDETDDWDPEPADLRAGESTDGMSHAERNAAMIRDARAALAEDEPSEADS